MIPLLEVQRKHGKSPHTLPNCFVVYEETKIHYFYQQCVGGRLSSKLFQAKRFCVFYICKKKKTLKNLTETFSKIYNGATKIEA